MRPQGWQPDPYGGHSERWYSEGRPTNLVRDADIPSYEGSPPKEPPPDWRWWTVLLPGVMGLLLAGLWLWYAIFSSAMNCFDGCSPISAGMPVGSAGEVLVGIAAVTLLVAGLTRPDWRRACAAGLWVAFALGCVSAALIATSHPVSLLSPTTQESPLPSGAYSPNFDTPACTRIGGRVLADNSTCFGVPYINDHGQENFGQVWFGRNGELTAPADTVGTGATQAECQSGKYPGGPAVTKPGHWNAQLSFCMP
jgi:hypothetical protein